MSNQACSGTFEKAGFKVSVMTSTGYGSQAVGLADVRLTNHGNVDLSKLPVPPEWKPLYSFPAVSAYVSEKPVKAVSSAISTLLKAEGWEPYGCAGDSLHFKKNAVKLSAWPSVAPAQGGKTVIQLSSELMSVDLPAPPVLRDASYADVTKTLSLEVEMEPAALVAFYQGALGRAGWEATTDKLVTIDFEELMIFRNAAKDMITLKVHSSGGKLRATVQHQTAAELDVLMQQAKAEDSKRKAESARYAMKAAEKSARDRGTVAITVPGGATELTRKKDHIDFKLAAGTARLAVEKIRDDLVKEGWSGNTKQLDPTAGSVIVSKSPGVSVAIVYIDTGLENAKITISAFGTDIAVPKED